MEGLRCGWEHKQKNDEISRVSFRQTELNLESSLLTIWRLECEHLLSIRSHHPDLFLAKPDGLDNMILFEFGEIYGRKIIWLPVTTLILKDSLQSCNLFSIIGAYNVLQSP